MANDSVHVALDGPAGPLRLTFTPRGLFAVAFATGISRGTDRSPLANRLIRPVQRTICELVQRRMDGDPAPSLLAHMDWSETTAFRRQVWSVLWTVPWGQTISYAELARRIGQPTAVRAVAQACAANRWAIIIPCHRVVATDGTLGGYRWGLSRKRLLLAYEAAHQPVLRNPISGKDFVTDRSPLAHVWPAVGLSCGTPLPG